MAEVKLSPTTTCQVLPMLRSISICKRWKKVIVMTTVMKMVTMMRLMNCGGNTDGNGDWNWVGNLDGNLDGNEAMRILWYSGQCKEQTCKSLKMSKLIRNRWVALTILYRIGVTIVTLGWVKTPENGYHFKTGFRLTSKSGLVKRTSTSVLQVFKSCFSFCKFDEERPEDFASSASPLLSRPACSRWPAR